jgi:hypothetical protein
MMPPLNGERENNRQNVPKIEKDDHGHGAVHERPVSVDDMQEIASFSSPLPTTLTIAPSNGPRVPISNRHADVVPLSRQINRSRKRHAIANRLLLVSVADKTTTDGINQLQSDNRRRTLQSIHSAAPIAHAGSCIIKLTLQRFTQIIIINDESSSL